MKIKLYQCFQNWTDYDNIYLFSDTHFNDVDMYRNRFSEKFKNIKDDEIQSVVESLNEMQIKNINSVCGKRSCLILLGDVGDIEYVKRLNAGYKILILGNHDKGASNYKKEPIWIKCSYELAAKLKNKANVLYDNTDTDSHGAYYEGTNGLFDEVYEGPLMISDKILLSHEPVDFKYAFNIHGHDHSLWSIPDSMHMNVCAEHLNYKPILLKSIIESGKLKNVPNIHRETIDKAIAKKE